MYEQKVRISYNLRKILFSLNKILKNNWKCMKLIQKYQFNNSADDSNKNPYLTQQYFFL